MSERKNQTARQYRDSFLTTFAPQYNKTTKTAICNTTINYIMKKSVVLFISLICLVISCGKKAVEINPDFVGTWKWVHGNELETIEIDSDSKGTYTHCFNCARNVCNCEDPGTGKARVKDGKLHIGISKWNIGEMPTKTGAYRWEMGLDGHTYIN